MASAAMDELRRLKAEREKRRAQEELDALKAAQAAKSFAHFMRSAWHIVEPSTPMVWGRHLDALAEHLEACYRGDIKNLAVCVPPGSSKTYTIMQAFPAWWWTQDPGARFLCCANVSELGIQSSLQCREIVRSAWYQKHFPHVRISEDTDLKMWFGTTERGFRKVGTVGGRITGQKSDALLIDDANDAMEVHSKVVRDSVINWYDQAAHDRVNSFIDSRRIIVGQRTHRNDLIGHCIEKYGYEPLVITEEFEPARRYFTSIGWTDWRTEEGELLRPSRFGPAEVAKARKLPMYRAKYQQDPTDEEAAFYKTAYFARRWRWHPTKGRPWVVLDDGTDRYEFDASRTLLFATMDPAASARTSADYTACGVFTAAPRGDLVWLDCICRQVDIPDQPAVLREITAKWRIEVLGIEAVGANSAVFQMAQRMLLNPVPLRPTADKLVRSQSAILKAAQGGVWLPAPGVAHDFDVDGLIDELVRFTGLPNSGRDDRADCLSAAVNLMPQLVSLRMGKAGMPRTVGTMTGPRLPTPTAAPRFGPMAMPTIVQRR